MNKISHILTCAFLTTVVFSGCKSSHQNKDVVAETPPAATEPVVTAKEVNEVENQNNINLVVKKKAKKSKKSYRSKH